MKARSDQNCMIKKIERKRKARERLRSFHVGVQKIYQGIQFHT